MQVLTSLITEPQIAQRRLGLPSRRALGDLERAGDLGELSGRALGQPQFQLGVLVRRGLQGAEAAGHALAQHHPVLDVRVRGLGARGELDHGVGLVR